VLTSDGATQFLLTVG